MPKGNVGVPEHGEHLVHVFHVLPVSLGLVQVVVDHRGKDRIPSRTRISPSFRNSSAVFMKSRVLGNRATPHLQVFLDEVTETSRELQVKLLRVLETRPWRS